MRYKLFCMVLCMALVFAGCAKAAPAPQNARVASDTTSVAGSASKAESQSNLIKEIDDLQQKTDAKLAEMESRRKELFGDLELAPNEACWAQLPEGGYLRIGGNGEMKKTQDIARYYPNALVPQELPESYIFSKAFLLNEGNPTYATYAALPEHTVLLKKEICELSSDMLQEASFVYEKENEKLNVNVYTEKDNATAMQLKEVVSEKNSGYGYAQHISNQQEYLLWQKEGRYYYVSASSRAVLEALAAANIAEKIKI